jgi:hypothetical protein
VTYRFYNSHFIPSVQSKEFAFGKQLIHCIFSFFIFQGVISISGVYDLLCLNKHWLRHVYLEPTFGTSSKQWLQASPEHLAQRSKSANTMPKFLLILAEYDIFLKSQSYKFAQTLGKLNWECKHVEISKSNHFNVVTNTSTGKGTTLSYVIEFIK